MRALLLFAAALASAGCSAGSPATTNLKGVVLPAIETPPLACAHVKGGGCSCAPSDAGIVDASPALCSEAVVPDASCCAALSYPFAGTCLCAVGACNDGGGPVSSCSAPPAEIPAGKCNPDLCNGMSCGGGECCVNSCQDGQCVESCS